VSLRFVSAEDRPDLVERRGPLLDGWPEFMLHDPVASRCWDFLYERFPAFQHFLVDAETDELVADFNSLPVRVHVDALPDRGWDEVLELGTAAIEPANAVSAISVEVLPSRRGEGLSHLCLARMRENAVDHGFDLLVAPVRPSSKHRYPLVPMESYVEWRTANGLPFDPWLRAHTRVGGQVVSICHESMTIPGSVADWEAWASMSFPESGAYVVPGALTLVSIEREHDRGTYVEPNVWLAHRLSAS
jgi:GNAT superfamily N-acetyltransferase